MGNISFLWFAVSVLGLTVLFIKVSDADDFVVVQTTNGRVRGRVQDGVNAFLGIPYAKPPVNDLR